MPRPTRNRLSHVISGLVGFTGALVLLAANSGSEPAETGSAAETLDAVNPLPTGDGAAPDEPAVGIGPQWDVLNWGPGPRGAVPSVYGIDTVVDGRTEQKVFVSSQANDDVGAADSITNLSTSSDSAVSFLTTERNAPVGALNMVRLGDGSLMSIEFIPEWADEAHTSVYLRSWHSADQGETWELRKGLYTPPAGSELGPMNRGLRVHGGPALLADGTIVVPAYTAYMGRRASSIFLQSTDGGATWSQRSEIPAGASTNEVGWSRTVDGDLIAVVRTAESPARLQVTFSHDDGLTWDTAKPLLDPDGVQVVGIYPNVVLQPNGVLMMSTGRPDTRVLIDYDGTGETWDENQLVYVRYPSETGNGRYDGTSGNTDLVNVDANRTVFIGDKCHVWGCKAYHEQYGVFALYVHAVTPGTGKIDVATKLISGTATVSGTFANGDKRFPEQRAEGAFDGSSQPRAAAVVQARRGAPSMVVELDQVYTLNRIGLMLGTGQPSTPPSRSRSTGRRGPSRW
ncbi:MAG TPA: exo-alpha-sialidase [Jiangellaceae bacterium]